MYISVAFVRPFVRLCPSVFLSVRLSAGVYLVFLTRGISIVSGGGCVRKEDLNLSAILMYIVSMISSV